MSVIVTACARYLRNLAVFSPLHIFCVFPSKEYSKKSQDHLCAVIFHRNGKNYGLNTIKAHCILV